MKSKSLIMMVVAMGCGLVAAYTTAKLTAKSSDDDEMILVANTEVKIGTVLKEPDKLFVLSPHKKGTAPGAVAELEKLKDKVVTRTLRPGQFVVLEDLSTNFGITPPKGTKAMAIKVTADSAVAGFIMPGSRVDVMATLGDANVGKPPEVQTVLQNQEVLAVDRISVRPDGQSAVETIGTVTLAVTPSNAQKLELALSLSHGVVRLLLRDQNDTRVSRITPRKSLVDDSGDFEAGGDGAVVRALAAKEDIPAGTVIDDPAKWFRPISTPSLPERGYLEGDLAKLKGQTVKTALFKDNWVTLKHLEGEVGDAATSIASATPAHNPADDVHVMFIQNGGKEPQMITYRGGVLVNGESSHSAGGTPTPVPPLKPADEKKDAPKPDKADKPEKKE